MSEPMTAGKSRYLYMMKCGKHRKRIACNDVPLLESNSVKKPSTEICESANKDMEPVEVPLPNSMHTGQIIMLTKMLTASDLQFYEFEGDVPMRRWYF